MTCDEIRTEIVAAQRGECSADTAETVKRHIENCCDCRSVESAYQDTFSVLQSLPRIEPSAGALRALLERVNRIESAPLSIPAVPQVLVPSPAPALALASHSPSASVAGMREVTSRWWRKAQQRAAVPLAAAAALLLAIGYLSLPSRPTSAIAPLQVARVLSHSPAFDGTPLRRISSEFGQPTPVVPGAGIHTAELLVSDVGALTVMEMPEVGLLHLAGAAHCRFAGPRHLLLEDGDLEANILPRGREFTIETPAGVVTVLGTRFRVRASRFGTVITVSHGKVRFANAHGTVAVGAAARSAATPETAPSRPVEVDPLAPLGEAERAVLWRDPRLALDFAAASCLPGTPLAARIHVTSPNPVTWLQPLTDAASYYLLNVTRPDGASFQVRLNAFHPTELSANRRAKGRVLLGQDQSYDVECTLADIFTSPGKYQLSASYTESRAAGEAGDAWRGILTSAPVTIDVADHP